MTHLDKFSTYRRVVASATDSEEVYWWYFGTVYVRIPDTPEIVATQVETVMVYTTETTTDDQFKIHWREIGYFRDPASGGIAESWLNPLTGQRVPCPAAFEEGPGGYTVTGGGNDLTITAVQPHARIRSIETHWQPSGERLMLTQTERKLRGFPKADGTLPDLDTDGGFEAETQLVFFTDKDNSAPVGGVYRFALNGLPTWMGFGSTTGSVLVRGIMAKSAPDNPPNALAWERLAALFPGFLAGSPAD